MKPCRCKFADEFIGAYKEGFTCRMQSGAVCKVCTMTKCRDCNVTCRVLE